jgi:hypothetical protein
MQAAIVFMLFGLASGLEIEEVESEPENGKYAYVTMWVNKATAPAHMFNRVLSKDETVMLNTGIVSSDTGAVDLTKGQKISSSVFLEEEGTEAQKLPLRPRNSNYNGILDIAKNLRDVGAKYPLVVLTNAEELRNETIAAENPNLQLIWLNDTDFLERNCKIGAGHEMHYQKLMIWKLTQYDKLIWLDTDVAFANNVDYAFKMDTKAGSRIYGQIDDYHCDGREWSPTSGGICSAMLLLKPSTKHFQGLMMQQKRMQACWGDQSIISSYFNNGRNEAIQFKRSTINFARCKSQGFMDVVHFSGSPDAKRIGDPAGFKRTSTGQLVNMTALKIKAEEKAAQQKAQEKKQKKMDLHKKK